MDPKLRSLSGHGWGWRVKYLSKVVGGIHTNNLTPQSGLYVAYRGPQMHMAPKIGSLSGHGWGWRVEY